MPNPLCLVRDSSVVAEWPFWDCRLVFLGFRSLSVEELGEFSHTSGPNLADLLSLMEPSFLLGGSARRKFPPLSSLIWSW